MDRYNCFSKIIADVFPPWHCVITQLNAPDQQTDKTSAFIEMLTLAHDQLFNLISCTWLILSHFVFYLCLEGAI